MRLTAPGAGATGAVPLAFLTFRAGTSSVAADLANSASTIRSIRLRAGLVTGALASPKIFIVVLFGCLLERYNY